MRASVPLAALAALLCTAPAAHAHSVMKVDGGTIHYTANDDVSLNKLEVTAQGDQIRFFDPGASGGVSPPADGSCTQGPGLGDDGNPAEVLCPKSGKTAVRIEVGEAQDKVAVSVPLAITAVGGAGADTITTSDGADTLNGGSGNDTIDSGGGNDQIVGEAGDDALAGGAGDDVVQGALGVDTADGGAGNDDVRVRDGQRDRAICADGNDRVQADEADDVDATCENVDRQATAPPSGGDQPPPSDTPGGGGGPPPPPDTTAPRVRAGGSTLQRTGRSVRVVVLATASEAAELVAGGYVTVGEERYALRSARGPVTVGGSGVRLVLTLEPRDARKVWRRLTRKRKGRATISVVATDTAGNSSAARLPRITLRR